MAGTSSPPLNQHLREAVLGPLLAQNAVQKAEMTLALNLSLPIDPLALVSDPGGIPGRPAKPELVAYTSLKSKPLTSPGSQAFLTHPQASAGYGL